MVLTVVGPIIGGILFGEKIAETILVWSFGIASVFAVIIVVLPIIFEDSDNISVKKIEDQRNNPVCFFVLFDFFEELYSPDALLNDNDFNSEDFNDCHHLNKNGAIKLTKKIKPVKALRDSGCQTTAYEKARILF